MLTVSTVMACAPASSNDPTNANANAPSGDGVGTRAPASSATWKTISLFEKGDLNLPCENPTVFTIRTNGSWKYDACQDPQSGKLRKVDLVALSSQLRLIIKGGFEESCADGQMTGLHLIQLGLSNGQDIALREFDEDTNCHRGNIALVDALDKQVVGLRLRYVKH
jgi:hypothetical protein